MASSKARLIGYWATTALLLLPFGAGGVADIMLPEEVAKTFAHLGYPSYFAIMLGVGKLLGMAVVLAPALPRAKEWAYAAFAVDLVAALVSHIAVDGVTSDVAPPIVFMVVLVASWHLRPESRRLAGPVV